MVSNNCFQLLSLIQEQCHSLIELVRANDADVKSLKTVQRYLKPIPSKMDEDKVLINSDRNFIFSSPLSVLRYRQRIPGRHFFQSWPLSPEYGVNLYNFLSYKEPKM